MNDLRQIFRAFRALCMLLALSVAPAPAQDMSALARLERDGSGAHQAGDELIVSLSLTQAVPYRVFTLGDPWRLLVDFREADWGALDRNAFLVAPPITGIRGGHLRGGWSRLVVSLDRPMELRRAGMRVDPVTGGAQVGIAMGETTAEAFRPSWIPDRPEAADTLSPIRRYSGDRPLVVVLDPGHGGIDPGAESDGLAEADLMLRFARTLREQLLRAGNFKVVLTREEDIFVPLERRVSIARTARADVFLSLHADSVSEGGAAGATVYTLSGAATDAASARLAERHDRADLLAGVDLAEHDDTIATVLMDLVRTETEPRASRLADALVEGFRTADIPIYKHPRQSAGFSVLKAPDIPSALVELGFMSSPRDLENLKSAGWRQRAAGAIVSALRAWAQEDAQEAQLIRR